MGLWLLFMKFCRPDLCTFCCDQEFLDISFVFCFQSSLCICQSLSNSNAILSFKNESWGFCLISEGNRACFEFFSVGMDWPVFLKSVSNSLTSASSERQEMSQYVWDKCLGKEGAWLHGTDAHLQREEGLVSPCLAACIPASSSRESVVIKLFSSPGKLFLCSYSKVPAYCLPLLRVYLVHSREQLQRNPFL